MQPLSISTAWSETVAFVGREIRLLFPIAFLLLTLPSVVMQLLMPDPASMSAGAGDPVMPDFSALLGWWLLLVPVVIVASALGSLAISILALRPGRSVAEALREATGRLLSLIGAMLLISIAGGLIIFLVTMVIGGVALAGSAGPGVIGMSLLIFLVLLVILVALWVRLMLMTPVAAGEPVGPIAIIARSWRLTGPHFWKLLGTVLLLILVAMVVTLVYAMIIGLIVMLLFGPPTPGGVSAAVMLLFGALLNAVLAVFFTAFTARVYAQLTGRQSEVGQVFT